MEQPPGADTPGDGDPHNNSEVGSQGSLTQVGSQGSLTDGPGGSRRGSFTDGTSKLPAAGQKPAHASVQQWSRLANESMYHRELLQDATKYLQETSAMRSRLLNTFIEDFKDDPHSALPHLQMFLTTPAKAIGKSFSVHRVERSDPICDVLKILSHQDAVVVSGHEDEQGDLQPDVLWGAKAVFCKALTCLDFDAAVETIMSDVPELPSLHHSSTTLFQVLRVMCVNHLDTVGLIDDGRSVIALITFSDISAAFHKEVTDIYSCAQPALAAARRSSSVALSPVADDDAGEEQLVARNFNESKTLRTAIKGKVYISRIQKLAQDWVESPATEALIFFLMLLDVTLTVWDAVAGSDVVAICTCIHIYHITYMYT